MSRRTAVYGVILISQLVGAALAAVLLVVRAESLPLPSDVLWAMGGGLLGAIGLTSLYRALAIGRMGIVAPVTGLLAAVIPVMAGIVLEGVPDVLVMLGIAIALVSVVLVSRVADEGGGRAGLGLALISGTSIGVFGIVISRLTDGHVFGPLVIVRLTQCVATAVFLAVSHAAWRPARRLVPAITLVGLADMGGNAFYILAVQSGALAIASVTSSLYPVTTVILAAVVLRERVSGTHLVGILLAGLAIVLIGLGSA